MFCLLVLYLRNNFGNEFLKVLCFLLKYLQIRKLFPLEPHVQLFNNQPSISTPRVGGGFRENVTGTHGHRVTLNAGSSLASDLSVGFGTQLLRSGRGGFWIVSFLKDLNWGCQVFRASTGISQGHSHPHGFTPAWGAAPGWGRQMSTGETHFLAVHVPYCVEEPTLE